MPLTKRRITKASQFRVGWREIINPCYHLSKCTMQTCHTGWQSLEWIQRIEIRVMSCLPSSQNTRFTHGLHKGHQFFSCRRFHELLHVQVVINSTTRNFSVQCIGHDWIVRWQGVVLVLVGLSRLMRKKGQACEVTVVGSVARSPTSSTRHDVSTTSTCKGTLYLRILSSGKDGLSLNTEQ